MTDDELAPSGVEAAPPEAEAELGVLGPVEDPESLRQALTLADIEDGVDLAVVVNPAGRAFAVADDPEVLGVTAAVLADLLGEAVPFAWGGLANDDDDGTCGGRISLYRMQPGGESLGLGHYDLSYESPAADVVGVLELELWNVAGFDRDGDGGDDGDEEE